jgi:P4 family phage/plasmid primase-like protien
MSAQKAPKMGEKKSEAPKPSKSFKRGDHVELAQRLLQALGPAEHTVADEGQIYRYENGLWRDVKEHVASRIVQGFSGELCHGGKTGRLKINASDVIGAMRLASAQAAKEDFFARAPEGLAFRDKWATVNEKAGIVTSPLKPENRARVGYDFDFPTENKAPSDWRRYLNSLFRDDTDKKEKIACLQEALGVSLLGRATEFQKSLFLVGDGGEGKSTFLEIIEGVFPKGSVSSVPPQQWSDQYRRAMLVNRLLNFVAELPASDLLATDAFKAIITGDSIDAREIYKAPFSFRPRAGHVFALNALPGTVDQSKGFWRRPVVIKFTRRFQPGEVDPGIARRLLGACRPGIVRWLLEGAARALKQGSYTLPQSHHDEMARWRLESDQVAGFLAAETHEANAGEKRLYAATLYQMYLGWVGSAGHKEMSSTKFGKRVKLLMVERGLSEGRHTEWGWEYPLARGAAKRLKLVASPGLELTSPDGLLTGHQSGKSPRNKTGKTRD